MHLKKRSYQRIKNNYLKFIKSQEVLSEPFRNKIGQLNNFYLPISKMIFKNYTKNKYKPLILMGFLTRYGIFYHQYGGLL